MAFESQRPALMRRIVMLAWLPAASTRVVAVLFVAAKALHLLFYVCGEGWPRASCRLLRLYAVFSLLAMAAAGLVKFWTFPIYLLEVPGKTPLRTLHNFLQEMIFWPSGFGPATATMECKVEGSEE